MKEINQKKVEQIKDEFTKEQESVRVDRNYLVNNKYTSHIDAPIDKEERTAILNYLVDQSKTNSIARLTFLGAGALFLGGAIINRDMLFSTGTLNTIVGSGSILLGSGSLFMSCYTSAVKNMADQSIKSLTTNTSDKEDQKLKILSIKERHFDY